jgi:sulfate transport system permease protein
VNGDRASALPGFGLTLGLTFTWVGLLVVLPLAALAWKGVSAGPHALSAALSSPRVAAALRLSVGVSLAAAAVNAVFGLVVAWVLARYRFPARRVLDAAIDLPFALPTAVAGIALATVWARSGWLGRPLAALGVPVSYTRFGIVVALTFVGLPFVVRTLEPVIRALDPSVEEAASSLGATRAQVVRRVVLPSLVPAWATGFALALGRALGEYGSVVFIAGNMPMKTEIAPLLVVSKLEQYDPAGACAIALALLAASIALLVFVNLLQGLSRARSVPA